MLANINSMYRTSPPPAQVAPEERSSLMYFSNLNTSNKIMKIAIILLAILIVGGTVTIGFIIAATTKRT